MRVQDGSFAQKEDGAGMAYYHNTTGELKPYTPPPKPDRLSRSTLDALYNESMRHTNKLPALAEALGVPLHTLERLCVGWLPQATLIKHETRCKTDGAFTFPMRDQHCRIIGFRLRVGDNKYSLKGGRNGLFIPRSVGKPKSICVVEGPTDTAAMLAYGHVCIGRPNNSAGTAMLADYLNKLNPERVEIVIDNDDGSAKVQTEGGAVRLVEALQGSTGRVWICDTVKDVRQAWSGSHELREVLCLATITKKEIGNDRT
jgi:hypothetical protein